MDKVLQMALNNELSYIISDQSMIFGLNIPINNIVIMNDI